MRLAALLTIALLASALPALARDPMAKDGKFTICQFQNFDKCELLTDRTLPRYRLNTREKRTLAALKLQAEAKTVSLTALAKSFGKPSKIFPHASHPNDTTLAWFFNSVGLDDLNAKCPECGIYVYVSSDVVTSLNYIVDGKFTIGWNRAEKP
jgi:hypothetical protein